MAREKPCFHGKSRMKAQIYRDGQLVVQTKAEAVKCGMASSPFPRIDEFFVLHRHCGVDSVDVWPDPEIEAPGLHRLHTRCAVCGAVESELIRVSAIEAYHRAIDDNATLIRAMAEAERRVKRH